MTKEQINNINKLFKEGVSVQKISDELGITYEGAYYYTNRKGKRNTKKEKETQRKYREKNKEKRNAYARKYREEHKDYWKIYYKKYRKNKNLPAKLNKDTKIIRNILKEYGKSVAEYKKFGKEEYPLLP